MDAHEFAKRIADVRRADPDEGRLRSLSEERRDATAGLEAPREP